MKKGIGVAGNLIMDIIKTIAAFPKASELCQIEDIKYATGGLVCNTGLDLAILDPDLKLQFFGVIGEDSNGDKILEKFSEYKNIDTSNIIRRGTTSFTDVYLSKKDLTRTFFTYGGACDTFTVEDIDISALDCKLFHLGYLLLLKGLDASDDEYGTKAARLLKKIQDAGVRTSIDVVSEVGNRYLTIIPPALKYTDYFIANEIEAGRVVGVELRGPDGALKRELIPDVLKKLRSLGVRRWVVIHCPEGGFGIDENDNFVEVPSLNLPEGFIVNTTGAGDAFCSGVLLAAYNDESLEGAIADGNAVAAASLRSMESTGSVETIDKVRALAKTLA